MSLVDEVPDGFRYEGATQEHRPASELFESGLHRPVVADAVKHRGVAVGDAFSRRLERRLRIGIGVGQDHWGLEAGSVELALLAFQWNDDPYRLATGG